MDVTDFLKNIKNYKDSRMFLIAGEENYLRDTAVEKLLEILPFGSRELNCARITGKADLAAIRAACEQLPCLADCRVVMLEDLDFFEKGDAKGLIEYLGQASPTTRIVFICRKMPDARRSLYKYLEKNAVVVQAGELKDSELIRWILATAKKKKCRISKEDAQFLCEMAGRDMYTLQHEIDKFAMLGKGEVTRDDLEALASRTTEYDTFSFHKLMLEEKYEQAFAILAEISRSGQEYLKFLGLIASKFTPMYMAKSCLNAGYSEREAAGELMSRAGIKKYPAELAVQECKKFTIRQLRDAIRLLEKADLTIKSGGADEGCQPTLLRIYGVV